MFEIIPNWHPIFVHFTVSTLSLASIFFVLSHVMRSHPQNSNIRKFAEWNLWIGSISTILTVIAGWIAYNSVAHDTPSHEAMTIHRNWALATAGIFIVLALWLFYIKRSHHKVNISFVVIIIIAFGMLGTTAWRGGETVYRYGLGVISLPAVEKGADGHAHEHAGQSNHTDGNKVVKMPMDLNSSVNEIPHNNQSDDHANHKH